MLFKKKLDIIKPDMEKTNGNHTVPRVSNKLVRTHVCKFVDLRSCVYILGIVKVFCTYYKKSKKDQNMISVSCCLKY